MASFGISSFAIPVTDYDEALKFYTEKLGFNKKQDVTGDNYRWVTVTAPDTENVCITFLKTNDLAKTGTTFIGLVTKDAQALYALVTQNKVNIIEEMSSNDFGAYFQFADLYGNKYNVLQRKQ